MNGFNNFAKKIEQVLKAEEAALDAVGVLVKGEYIRNLEKGHHVVTGKLVGSPAHRVIDNGIGRKAVRVGTNVEYAGFVEYGTSKSRAYPCLRPAVDDNREKIQKLFKEVIGNKL
jgi:HK97 gp10 family phage protein